MRRPRPLGSPGLYTHPGLLPSVKSQSTTIAGGSEAESKTCVPVRSGGGPSPAPPPTLNTSPSQTAHRLTPGDERPKQVNTPRDEDGFIDPSNRSVNSCHDFLTSVTSFDQQQQQQQQHQSAPAQAPHDHVWRNQDGAAPCAPLPLSSNLAGNNWHGNAREGRAGASRQGQEHSTNSRAAGAVPPPAAAYAPVTEARVHPRLSASGNEVLGRWLANPPPNAAGATGTVLVPSPPPEPTPPTEPAGGLRYTRPCGATSPPPHHPEVAVARHRGMTRDGYWHPVYTSSTDGDSTGFHSNASERCTLAQPRSLLRQPPPNQLPPPPPRSPLDATLAPHERQTRRGAPSASSTTAPPPGTPRPPISHPSTHSSPLTPAGATAAVEDGPSMGGSAGTPHATTLAPLHSPTGGPICSSDSTVFSYAETKAPVEATTPTGAWVKDGLYAVQPAVSATPGPSPLPCVALPRTPERRHPTTPHLSSPVASPPATPSSSVSMTTTTTTVTAGGGAGGSAVTAPVAASARVDKHCRMLPMLPSQLPDGLVQLYGTDTRQAAAATSVLEAVQRTAKARGRRPPSPQTTGLQVGPKEEHTSATTLTTTTTTAVSPSYLGPFFPPSASGAILLPTTLPSNPVPAGPRASLPRQRVGGSNTSNNSSHPRSPRKTVVVKSTTTTTTTITTTTVATLSGESTDFIHSAVSNPGLSVSNTITNRHVSSAEDTSASSLALQPRVLSMRWFRGSETGLDAPSLLSLVDIGLGPDVPSPHRPAPSVQSVEERSAAGLPPELQHLPAVALAARSTTASSHHPLHNGHGSGEAAEQPPVALVKALSHMECAAQPQPDLARADASFYRQSLLEVANKMAELPSSPELGEEDSPSSQPPSIALTPQVERSANDGG